MKGTPVVEVAVPAGDVDAVSVELWVLGASAIEETGAGSPAGLGPVLRAGMPDEARARDALQALAARYEAHLAYDDPDGLWWDGWRAYARPVRSGRITVVPVWDGAPGPSEAEHTVSARSAPGGAGPDRPGPVRLVLDAGRSFGTGAHPTTRLALRALSAQPLAGCSVLDLGSGSGVLAVAAAQLGAAHVSAVDVAPAARLTTGANAARNNVDVDVSAAVAAQRRFDVVVANLPAEVWESMAAPAIRVLRTHGTMIATGFLEARWQTLGPLFSSAGAQPYARSVLDQWGCRLLRRVR